ncbi:hypothetical protein FACS1894163_09600 [Spirochaetia bacterium]|nr:hypothetical protein FACS1894163_09600 [Spirochaetia bacterium]
MNKAKSLIIAAGMLAALLLTTCEMEFTDSLPLPPELPYGKIVKSPDTDISFNNYSFVLEWNRKEGILYPDVVYNTEEVTDALDQAYNEWENYTRLINPLPFYDKVGDGKVPENQDDPAFVVFLNRGSGWKLDNSGANGNIVIRRYWPPIKDASTGQLKTPTRTEWLEQANIDTRKAAFKKAAGEIEAMIANIETSPFYNTGLPAYASLMKLHTKMVEWISYNPAPAQCIQRMEFSVAPVETTTGAARLPTGTSGPLYEYYLGHAPPPTEYTTNSGQFALPEE